VINPLATTILSSRLPKLRGFWQTSCPLTCYLSPSRSHDSHGSVSISPHGVRQPTYFQSSNIGARMTPSCPAYHFGLPRRC
jgi:hypothetical protein